MPEVPDVLASASWRVRARCFGFASALLALGVSGGVQHGLAQAADASPDGVVMLQQGYVLTDPGNYDDALKVQAEIDKRRSSRDCFCGESVHKAIWLSFHGKLHTALLEDPSFSGDWVHEFCGLAYPAIFRIIAVEPADDSFTMHTDCPAGLLAMLLVCAQSAALRNVAAAAPPPPPASSVPGAGAGWRHTARVVREEGPSVGDIFGAVALDACLAHCERQPACRSVSFGPHGCHLKARCVHTGEPMVPEGEQGADYQTFYREPCPGDPGGTMEPIAEGGAHKAPEPGGGATEQNSPLEELQNMIRFALRALEFCFHCLDASPWPFLLAEVLENYALAVEGSGDFTWQRAAGRLIGPSTDPGITEASGVPALAVPSLDPPAAGTAAPPTLSPLRMVLLRLHVRWIRGFEMEAEFWRRKLSRDPSENNSLERLERWLATGEVTWFLEDDDLCGFLRGAARLRGALDGALGAPGPVWSRGPPRILNAGSGPFAPGPLECDVESSSLLFTRREPEGSSAEGGEVREGGSATRWHVPIVAADGMARFYLRVLDEHGLVPPHRPVQCPVEELHACFPARHFDVVHMRNSLDHAFDPLLGLQRMLHVLRPGGWLLLRHARNEGVPGKFRNGLHQWAFDAMGEDGLQASMPAFVIWNPELRVNVTAHLLGTGLAAEVRTALRQHPSDDAPPDERYVWVDIRKPTEAEAASRRLSLQE